MIVITGAAGFIGSNIALKLNQAGRDDLILVDAPTTSDQLSNLHGLKYYKWLSPAQLMSDLDTETAGSINSIFHQGAVSDTTCQDWDFLYRNNVIFTKKLVDYSIRKDVKLIYASSASVYGLGREGFSETTDPTPINFYAFSKSLCDQYIQQLLGVKKDLRVYGLRYFNVYGPREFHKGAMSSVMLHFRNQLLTNEQVKLFGPYADVKGGEQQRDFIHVDDVAEFNLRFMERDVEPGIYNLGTGRAVSYNQIAEEILNFYQRGEITYIPFPDHLKGRYQSFTCSDNQKLQLVFPDLGFLNLEDGVRSYLQWLDEN